MAMQKETFEAAALVAPASAPLTLGLINSRTPFGAFSLGAYCSLVRQAAIATGLRCSSVIDKRNPAASFRQSQSPASRAQFRTAIWFDWFMISVTV